MLTDADRQEVKDIVWEMLAGCGLVESLPANTDAMVTRVFQVRALPYLKGRLRYTKELEKVTAEDIAFIRGKLGDGET